MPSPLRISPNAIDCAIGLADTNNVSDGRDCDEPRPRDTEVVRLAEGD